MGARRLSSTFLVTALLAGVLTVAVQAIPVSALPIDGDGPVRVLSAEWGSPPDRGGSEGAVSGDGRGHAFISTHDFLGDGLDGTPRLYVTGHGGWLVRFGEGAGIAEPSDPVVADRGLTVAFTALIDPTDAAAGRTVYIGDVASGIAWPIEERPDREAGRPSISDDGRKVAYETWPTGSPESSEIRVWDGLHDSSTRVDVGADGPGTSPAISGDGETVAFTTAAGNLVPGVDFGGGAASTQVVARHLPTGVNRLVSSIAGAGSAPAPDGASWVDGPDAVSYDGSAIAFVTSSAVTAFVDVDADPGGDDIILRTGDGNRLVSRTPDGGPCVGSSSGPAVADGGVVAFASNCIDIHPSVSDPAATTVYLQAGGDAPIAVSYDSVTGEPRSDAVAGIAGPSISRDGTAVVFTTSAALVPDDANGVADAYLVGAWDDSYTVDITEPNVDAITRACPPLSRSISVDGPELDVQTSGEDLGVRWTFEPTAEGWGASVGWADWDADGNPTLRAVVVRGGGPADLRTIRWDFGAGGSSEATGDYTEDLGLPVGFVPNSAVICVPATAELGPGALDDSATALAGATIEVDVLANDEGAIVPATLAVESTTAGTAEVVNRGGRRLISFTAPAEPGISTVAYSVADRSGRTATGQLQVAVQAPAVNPFALAIDGPAVAPDLDTPVTVTASNSTGDDLAGGLVTVAARAPATISAAAGDGWSCTIAAGAATATCSTSTTAAPGSDLPAISTTVLTPNGPQHACSDAQPDGAACVSVRAWNGAVGDESSADPAPATRALPYSGGVARATIDSPAAFQPDSSTPFSVAVSNAGSAPLPAGSVIEIVASPADMTFDAADSAAWDCSPVPDDATRATCVSTSSIEAGATTGIQVVYDGGDGLATGCPDGSAAPCALLAVNWVDAVSPSLRVPVAEGATGSEAGSTDGPDVMVQLSHPSAVWTGTDTTIKAIVANAGLGPTTGSTVLDVELPAGFAATSATGAGWSCSIVGDTKVDCERTAALPTGAISPTVLIEASVASDAIDGDVVATVSTAGDAVPLNDVDSSTLVVRSGDLEDPDGPSRLAVIGEFPQRIGVGATERASFVVSNDGTTAEPGPTSVRFLFPDGIPAGQVVTAELADGPTAWACADTELTGVREVVCTYPDEIAPGGISSVLELDVRAVAANPGGTIDVTISHLLHGVSVNQVRRMIVTPPPVARLAVSTRQAVPVAAGRSTTIDIDARNVGTGTPVEDVAATIEMPDGLTVESVGDAGWECTGVGGGDLSCSTAQRPLPGTPLAPLSIEVVAAADVEPGRPTASIEMRTVDPLGERTTNVEMPIAVVPAGIGMLDISHDGLPQAASATRSISYDLVVGNAGENVASGTLVVREQFPLGTVATGSGDGWTCARSGQALRCERPDTSIAASAAAPQISIEATFPAGLAGARAQISTTASLGWSEGSTATGVSVPAPVVPVVDLAAEVSVTPSQLIRSSPGTARMGIRNDGNTDSAPPILVMSLSRGVVPRSAGGPGWSCEIDSSTTAASVACARADGVAPSTSTPKVDVEFDVAAGAPDRAMFVVGPIIGADDVASALAAVRGRGAGALDEPVTDIRPVWGLDAQAGDDISVAERSVAGDGTMEPTRVRLDGRRTTSGPGGLSWRWVQTSGPDVVWDRVAGTTADANGVERPYASGPDPRLRVPRLSGDSPVDLTFELTATSGSLTDTDTVTVTVAPSPDEAPVLTGISTDLPQIAEAPVAGTRIALAVGADDPEGDDVSVSWRIASTDASLADSVIAGRTNLITEAGGEATAELVWPSGATYVVVEATAASARGATSTATLAIGQAPPPPSVTVEGPKRASSGEEIVVAASVEGPDPASITWRWRQISGPAVEPAELAAATGPELQVTAPVVTAGGEAVTFLAEATRVAGLATSSGSAVHAVAIDPPALPEPVIGAPASAAVDETFELDVTGVPADASVAWRQVAGPPGTFGSPSTASTTFRATVDGTAILEAVITDMAGRETGATASVRIGAPLVPASGDCTTSGSLLHAAYEAAASGLPLSASIGSVDITLGTVEVASSCGADPSLRFRGAGFSAAGGTLAGSDLSGTIDGNRLCITAGSLGFPRSWGLSEATLAAGTPICIALAPGSATPITGSLSVTGMPFLTMPAGTAAPVTKVSFDGSTIGIESTSSPLGGTLALAATIDPATGALTADVDGTLPIFGQTVRFDGSITYDGTDLDVDVHGSIPGPISITPGANLRDIDVSLGRSGIALSGALDIEDAVTVAVSGSFESAQRWSVAVDATTAADWEPIDGLVIPASELSGKVERRDGATRFDLAVAVDAAWSPTPGFTLDRITARLSNDATPAGCPTTEAGKAWLRASGRATAAFDGANVAVEASACVVPGSGTWSLTSTAALDSWRPIDGLDVSMESVGLFANGGAGPVEVGAFGTVRAFGLGLGATVTLRDGVVIVDGTGDISSISDLVPGGTTGHVVFSSGSVSGYRLRSAGSIPRIDPAFSALDLDRGISLYLGFDLPDDLRSFLRNHLSAPAPRSVVASVQLDSNPTLEVALDFAAGTDSATIYESCPADCVVGVDETRVSLHELALTIHATGFGVRGSGRLQLPATDQTPSTRVDLAASIAVDLKSMGFTASLSALDWENALGIDGLDMDELSVQIGYSTGLPSFGMLAEVRRLPDSMATQLGIDPDAQEPLSFGLNISASNPIFSIELGVADGHDFMDLLAPYGKPDILLLDHAQLVIAPAGGTIGTRTFSPGISLAFATTIADVPVDAAFGIDISTLHVHGEIAIGAFSAGPVNFNRTDLSFDLQPAAGSFDFSVAGGVNLSGLPGLSGDVSGEFAVSVRPTSFSASIDVEASEVRIGGVLEVESFVLRADVALGADEPFSAAFELGGKVSILGVADLQVAGSAQIGNGQVSDLSGAVALHIGGNGYELTGNGCDPEFGFEEGACVSFTDKRADLSAVLRVAGFTAAAEGRIMMGRASLAASIDIDSVGTFRISGDIDTRTQEFRFESLIETAEVGGFGASLSAAVWNQGGSAGVAVSGWVSLPGTSVNGSMSLARSQEGLAFSFVGEGWMSTGFSTIDVSVAIDRTAAGAVTASASGRLAIDTSVGSVDVEVTGGYGGGGGSPMWFELTGSGVVTLASVRGRLDLAISSRSGVSFTFDISATVFDIELHGSIWNGTWTASASASVVGVGVQIQFRKDTTGWSLTGSLTYKGHAFVRVAIGSGGFSATVEFSVSESGSVNLGLIILGGSFSATMSLTVHIYRSGSSLGISGDFAGSILVSGWYREQTCDADAGVLGTNCLNRDNWYWGGRKSLGSIGGRVDTATGTVCATLLGRELCF